MVDEVAQGGADVMLVNPNSQRVNYPSKVWQTFWEGYTKGDRSFFGNVPDESVKRREQWVGQMAQLAQRCDYMAVALARCRERNIAPGITLRMNDMHDAPWPGSHLFSRFYKENPRLHLRPLDERSWGAAGLDYAHAEVRRHFLALVRELAESYDFDVLELDFMRFPYYFERGNIDEHCNTMTGFIREVRQVLDRTGRHIALIPRVASSPGAARQLGFDVQAWAREGIVDGITAGNFLTTCWDLAVEDFRKLVGPRIAVYASSEVAADRREGLPVRYLPESYEMLRGFAAGYLAAGADGINTFNFFLARKHRPVTAAEFYGGLREMRSLKLARGKPRIHVLTAGFWLPECDMPEQVPVMIRAGRERKFEMLLAAEDKGTQVTVLVYFDGENSPDDVWLRINHHSGSHAVEIRKGLADEKSEGDAKDGSSHKSKIAVFKVPPGIIQDGSNQLIIRAGKVGTRILGIDVDVR
ncbi:MAG: hypothetical protein JXQ73_00815 [Phycisphaerae bacterium]|nr:hypothetical protein [Phycisphaerae bacterium]